MILNYCYSFFLLKLWLESICHHHNTASPHDLLAQLQGGFLSPSIQISPRSEKTAQCFHQIPLSDGINTNGICPRSFNYFKIKRGGGNDHVGWFEEGGLLCHITWQTFSQRSQPQPLQDEAMTALWQPVLLTIMSCQRPMFPFHSRCPLTSEVIFSMFIPVGCQHKLVLTSSCMSDNPTWICTSV